MPYIVIILAFSLVVAISYNRWIDVWILCSRGTFNCGKVQVLLRRGWGIAIGARRYARYRIYQISFCTFSLRFRELLDEAASRMSLSPPPPPPELPPMSKKRVRTSSTGSAATVTTAAEAARAKVNGGRCAYSQSQSKSNPGNSVRLLDLRKEGLPTCTRTDVLVTSCGI